MHDDADDTDHTKEGAERRKHLRIPVPISTRIHVTGTEPEFVYTAELVDYSMGGVGLIWDGCSTCGGYRAGSIDPDCIFWPYSAHRYDSDELTFHLDLANYSESLVFKGKPVYTLIEDGRERVGIQFTEISDIMYRFMQKVM